MVEVSGKGDESYGIELQVKYRLRTRNTGLLVKTRGSFDHTVLTLYYARD
jgi:hypothetical protein